MIGLFWNIRGLGKIGRHPALVERIKNTRADVVGITETKKESFTPRYLKSLTGPVPFEWFVLPAKRSAGGNLVGCNKEKFSASVCSSLDFTISIMIQDKKSGFIWKLVVVYGSPYEKGKEAFIQELHSIMQSWNGPVLLGGDFNLVRFATDKSNGNINYKWADLFNDRIHKWALVELSAKNMKFTWTNNQENPIMAKIDRIFVTNDWDRCFPLARVRCLERLPSDHNPLVLEAGDNAHLGKKYLGLKNGGYSRKALLRK